MKSKTALLSIAFSLFLSTSAFALYSVIDRGTWPKSWPKELESLRGQSRTLVGPMVLNRHYAIPFEDRDAFEAAWPHVLKVRHPQSPIILMRGPNFFLGGETKAGIVVHSPPAPPKGQPQPKEAPIAGVENPRTRWSTATYIELVVDGRVVDLDRIEIPDGIEIIDERKHEQPEGSTQDAP